MLRDDAFALLTGAFPTLASFQGTHFNYAVQDGTVLIETKKFNVEKDCPMYFYWLPVSDRFQLIHASPQSKLKQLHVISGDPFELSDFP